MGKFSQCYIATALPFRSHQTINTGDTFSQKRLMKVLWIVLVEMAVLWGISRLIRSATPENQFRGFRPNSTQTGLYSHRRRIEAQDSGFKKKRDCSIHVAKTKALISCAVTAQLTCIFVFA